MTNINLSGYKILKLLELFSTKGALTFDEIVSYFNADEFIGKEISSDVVTYCINSLRKLGIKILKPSRYNKSYRLASGLSLLHLTEDEIDFISKVKSHIVENGIVSEVVNFNKVLFECSKFIPERMQQIYEKKLLYSPISYEFNEFILNMNSLIDEKNVVSLGYNLPKREKIYFKVFPIQLKIEEGKLYLWCENIENNKVYYLRADRIEDISILEKTERTPVILKARFELYDEMALLYKPLVEEKIVKKSKNKIEVEISYQNEFWLIQKIKSFGLNAKLISPACLVEKVKDEVDALLEVYHVKD